MNQRSRIYLAGHRGLVGSAIYKKLREKGYTEIITRSSGELDLREQAQVAAFFEAERPEYVFLAAAKVGGILANSTYPAQFIYDNLALQTNVIHQAYLQGVKKLLFLGSSCIYPKDASQPLKEEYLLTGALEKTNEPYAVAKIAGIKMCQAYNKQYGTNFFAVMPTNLYGPGDNFNLETAHVLPALIRKIYEAKLRKLPNFVVWGSGKPRREFLHTEDLAAACFFLMHNYDSGEIINIGVGKDLAVIELAELIRAIVGYSGGIEFDRSKPDGTPQKLLDVSKINALGWKADIELQTGIKQTYDWYRKEYG